MSFLEYILLYIVLFVVIRFLFALSSLEKRTHLPTVEERMETLQQIQLEKQIDVDIQKIDNVFYMWNKKDGSFIAQGKNLDEIREICKIRYPGYAMNADVIQLKELGLET